MILRCFSKLGIFIIRYFDAITPLCKISAAEFGLVAEVVVNTYSLDVFKTASTVFGKVWCYGNFVIAGEAFALPPEDEAIRRLGSLLIVSTKSRVDIAHPEVVAKLRECMRNFEPYSAVEARSTLVGMQIFRSGS